MAEMILSSKAYVGVKRSWYWPKWASCLCAWLDCNSCSRVFMNNWFATNCIVSNKIIAFFSYGYKKTNVQAILQEWRIEDNKSIYKWMSVLYLTRCRCRDSGHIGLGNSIIFDYLWVALCFIHWKLTFLFFKPTFPPFACRKGNKLSLIFSQVATSSRVKT